MNKAGLIRSLLLGFLPILIFIVVEDIYGTTAGIAAAIAIGVVEIIVIYIREKRFDKLVLFDIGLVGALGGISLLFENDIFFKIKPAVFEAFFCVIIGVSIWGRLPVMQMMMQRQFKGTGLKVEPDNPALMKMMKMMFILFMVHTVLVVLAALYASSAVWGFVSGPLLYIIFGAMFLVQIIKARLSRSNSKPH